MHFALSVLLYCFVAVDGKIFKPKEFADELRKNGIPEWQIPTWKCIASVVNYDTSSKGDGDHGVLQINEIYWCFPPGTGCSVTCAQMENADISDDITCAKTIYADSEAKGKHGFEAWSAYKSHCKIKTESEIEEEKKDSTIPPKQPAKPVEKPNQEESLRLPDSEERSKPEETPKTDNSEKLEETQKPDDQPKPEETSTPSGPSIHPTGLVDIKPWHISETNGF